MEVSQTSRSNNVAPEFLPLQGSYFEPPGRRNQKKKKRSDKKVLLVIIIFSRNVLDYTCTLCFCLHLVFNYCSFGPVLCGGFASALGCLGFSHILEYVGIYLNMEGD